MDRRSFLRGLLGAAASAVVAPKIYVLPPANGWRAGEGGLFSPVDDIYAAYRGNALLPATVISREVLRLLHKNLEFTTNWREFPFEAGDKVTISFPSRLSA